MKWAPGNLLLDEYTVLKLLGQGGMGQVFLVETITPPILRYAVKILVHRLLDRSDMKRLFIQELQTWIDLPRHPNIVNCRFCKSIDGNLAIFSEYAEEGSLKSWIRSGKVDNLETILDIAIQTAWGLDAAHCQQLIHLDIKPDNILMTRDNTAKITDFGLSVFMQSSTTDTLNGSDHSSGRSPTGGLTPAYASPEQAADHSLTRQSDIWSWGVSVLEMFIGRVTWRYGFMAPSVLDAVYNGEFQTQFVTMMEPIYTILKRCFAEKPENRWQSMVEIADELIQYWSIVFGRPYHHQRPVLATPHGLQSGCASDFAVLRSWTPGDHWVSRAGTLAQKPPAKTSKPIVPQTMTARSYAMRELEKYDIALKLLSTVNSEQCAGIDEFMTRLLSEKSLIHEFIEDYPGAFEHARQSLDLLEKMNTFPDSRIQRRIVWACGNIGNLLYLWGNYTQSILYHERAVMLADSITEDIESGVWINSQARIMLNLAITLFGLKKYDRAKVLGARSVALREQLVFALHQVEYIEDLITSYTQLAAMRGSTLESAVSLELYDKAISLIERSSMHEATVRYGRFISSICMGKATVYRLTQQFDRAVEMFDSTIQILTRLVQRYDQLNDLMQLAIANINLGNLNRDQEDYAGADDAYGRGISMMQSLIAERGHNEFRGYLARGYISRVRLYIRSGQIHRVREPLTQFFRIYVSLIVEKKQDSTIQEFFICLEQLWEQLDAASLNLKFKPFTETRDREVDLGADLNQLFDTFEALPQVVDCHGLLTLFKKLRRIYFSVSSYLPGEQL